MSHAIQIVPFRLRHLDRILRIERASFGRDAWPRHLFLEYYNDCRELFFVGKCSGRIAGYIITCVEARAAEIVSLAVHPDCRRRGLAVALIGHVMRRLRRAGVRRIELMVRVNNTAGAQLYRSLGFRRVRTVPHYYEDGGDGFLMVRSVGQITKRSQSGGAATRPGP